MINKLFNSQNNKNAIKSIINDSLKIKINNNYDMMIDDAMKYVLSQVKAEPPKNMSQEEYIFLMNKKVYNIILPVIKTDVKPESKPEKLITKPVNNNIFDPLLLKQFETPAIMEYPKPSINKDSNISIKKFEDERTLLTPKIKPIDFTLKEEKNNKDDTIRLYNDLLTTYNDKDFNISSDNLSTPINTLQNLKLTEDNFENSFNMHNKNFENLNKSSINNEQINKLFVNNNFEQLNKLFVNNEQSSKSSINNEQMNKLFVNNEQSSKSSINNEQMNKLFVNNEQINKLSINNEQSSKSSINNEQSSKSSINNEQINKLFVNNEQSSKSSINNEQINKLFINNNFEQLSKKSINNEQTFEQLSKKSINNEQTFEQLSKKSINNEQIFEKLSKKSINNEQKNKYLVINSINRDLYNFPTPLQFQINFSHIDNISKYEAYYENDILLLSEQIVTYKKLNIINLQESLNNIKNISCKCVNIFIKTNEKNLFLNIPELKGNYVSCNKLLNNAFAKLENEQNNFISCELDDYIQFDKLNILTLNLLNKNGIHANFGIDKIFIESFSSGNKNMTTKIKIKNQNSNILKNDLLYFYNMMPTDDQIIFFEDSVRIVRLKYKENNELKIFLGFNLKKIIPNELFKDYYIILHDKKHSKNYILKIIFIADNSVIVKYSNSIPIFREYKNIKIGFAKANFSGNIDDINLSLFNICGYNVISNEQYIEIDFPYDKLPINLKDESLYTSGDVFLIQDKMQINYTFLLKN
jgi:hypothetical protein